MICLFPDCDYSAAGNLPVEAAKRLVIDHINHDHADAHVIIACAHDMALLEAVTLSTKDGNTGTAIELPHERYQCARCGQYEVRVRTPDGGGSTVEQ